MWEWSRTRKSEASWMCQRMLPQPKSHVERRRNPRPSSVKTELAEARLLSLGYPLVRRLVQDGSYVEKLIGSNDYCEEESTLTVGVQALLLGRGGSENLKSIEQLAIIV